MTAKSGFGTRDPAITQTRRERKGVAASPGVAVGKAYVLDRRRIYVPHRHISRGDIEAELKRFRASVRGALEELEGIKGRLSHGEHRQILKAQQLMLRDPDLAQDVEALIRDEGKNAEWAVAQTTDGIRDTLSNASEARFRDRQFDITFIGERLLRILVGGDLSEINPPEGAVVIGHDVSPADMAQLHSRRVSGLVTELGGRTSHTALMARAFEIPAVVGVEGLIDEIDTDDLVVVNATNGVVIVRPTEQESISFHAEVARYKAFEDKVQKEHGLLATTLDGCNISLRANVALEEDLESAVFHGAEGVGLYRTEYIYMNRQDPPTEEEHYRMAKRALQLCAPYPVTFRTFDLGSDKPCTFFGETHAETNPALGLRGLRLASREREHALAQLRGFLRAALHGPAQIMMPLIGGLSELRAGIAMLDEARAQLEESKAAYSPDIRFGIMIEVPSAAMMAETLAEHVDFLSIGTNDLIQYTLAIDRENDEVSYLYQPLHPAILQLIRQVGEAGRAHEVPVSVCGEMAADPLFTWVLMGLGIRELSIPPAAVPVVKNLIRSTQMSDVQGLMDMLTGVRTAEEAQRIALAEMRRRFPEHLQHGSGAGASEEG